MSGERIARHNQLRDAIFQVAQTANLAPLKETLALLPSTDSLPTDILIPHFSSGPFTAYDVTVINPLRRDCIEGSVENPGYRVQQAYKTKWNSYGPACEREGMNFVPLPVDVFGAWHEVAIKHLKKLGVTLARATCRDDSTTIQHLF